MGIGFVGVALPFGLTVLTMAYAVGHVSGGHFNPAVTIGCAVAKRFEWKDVPAYVITQVVAGLVAGAALFAIATGKPGFTAAGNFAANGYGAASPGGYGLVAALLVEVMLTAFFLYIILGATDGRAPVGFAPIAIGLGLTLIHLISIPVTNTSVNPAVRPRSPSSTAVTPRRSSGCSGWPRSSVPPSPARPTPRSPASAARASTSRARPSTPDRNTPSAPPRRRACHLGGPAVALQAPPHHQEQPGVQIDILPRAAALTPGSSPQVRGLPFVRRGEEVCRCVRGRPSSSPPGRAPDRSGAQPLATVSGPRRQPRLGWVTPSCGDGWETHGDPCSRHGRGPRRDHDMSHVLVTTTPFGGHQPPMLGLTRELVRAGHRVTYYTGAKFRERAEEVGATWLPWVEALDFDDTDLAATFPTMRTDAGMAAMFSSFEQLFFGTGPGQLRDLIRFHDADPVDVVVNELTCVGGGFLHESRGVPWASFSLSPLPLTSRHLPPSGLPVRPARGPLGRTRDAALRALVQASLGRRFRTLINAARVEAGLTPTAQDGFDSLCSRQLLLGQGVASLEYPRPDAPGTLHLIGDAAAGTRGAGSEPDWLRRLDPDRPIVHVTQGTLGLPGFDLVGAAVAALASAPAQIVVSGDPALVPPGADVIAPGWVPHDLLLPRTAVMITNGGYGAVLSALAHGVPLVVAPGAQDKPEVARRVAWSGAGLSVGSRPSPARLRRAVEACLGDSPTRRRAHEVAAEMERAGGARRAAALVAALA